MKKAPSRFRKFLNRLILVVLGVIIITLAIILYLSPGKTSPITDASGNELPNSIAVIEKPEINEVKQSIIIRGENKNNPVLLFVHGEPGIGKNMRHLRRLFSRMCWE